MIGEVTPARGGRMAGRDGFAQVLRSEWIKFWTVRGWVVSLVLAAVLTAGVTLAPGDPGGLVPFPGWRPGRGGIAVNDNFYFVHRSLAGDGSVTVRVMSLTDRVFPGQGVRSIAPQP